MRRAVWGAVKTVETEPEDEGPEQGLSCRPKGGDPQKIFFLLIGPNTGGKGCWGIPGRPAGDTTRVSSSRMVKPPLEDGPNKHLNPNLIKGAPLKLCLEAEAIHIILLGQNAD